MRWIRDLRSSSPTAEESKGSLKPCLRFCSSRIIASHRTASGVNESGLENALIRFLHSGSGWGIEIP